MREIKFRACIPTVNTREGFKLKSRFVLQQYAVFKDKTGRPIYEGDIIQWSYGEGDTTVFTGKVVFGHHSVGRDSWSMELYTVEGLSASDWAFWEKTRLARKAIRRQELEIKSKIQAEKLALFTLISE